MIEWKRPAGTKTLIGTLLVLVILTFMLGQMVAGRVAILEEGNEVVLRTAPVDPRDLLRGYYVRLNYAISTLDPTSLPEMTPGLDIGAIRRNDPLYVRLRLALDGFWEPVAISRKMPSPKPGTAIMRGTVRSNGCRTNGKKALPPSCRISLRYGIEKFFASQSEATRLENMRRLQVPQVTDLDNEIARRRKDLSQLLRNSGAGGADPAAVAELRRAIRDLENRRFKELNKQREEMAKRFGVVVRVSKSSGEAAIAGLQLDGRPIYEEPLF